MCYFLPLPTSFPSFSYAQASYYQHKLMTAVAGAHNELDILILEKADAETEPKVKITLKMNNWLGEMSCRR